MMFNVKYGLQSIITIDLAQKFFREHALHLYQACYFCFAIYNL